MKEFSLIARKKIRAKDHVNEKKKVEIRIVGTNQKEIESRVDRMGFDFLPETVKEVVKPKPKLWAGTKTVFVMDKANGLRSQALNIKKR